MLQIIWRLDVFQFLGKKYKLDLVAAKFRDILSLQK